MRKSLKKKKREDAQIMKLIRDYRQITFVTLKVLRPLRHTVMNYVHPFNGQNLLSVTKVFLLMLPYCSV